MNVFQCNSVRKPPARAWAQRLALTLALFCSLTMAGAVEYNPATGEVFKEPSESKAVAIARAQIEAWSHHDYAAARSLLAPDVQVTIVSTRFAKSSGEIEGADRYMRGLVQFAKEITAGSARILQATGDEKSALITVEVKASVGSDAEEMTITSARLYRLDENNKIKTEQVLSYTSGQ